MLSAINIAIAILLYFSRSLILNSLSHVFLPVAFLFGWYKRKGLTVRTNTYPQLMAKKSPLLLRDSVAWATEASPNSTSTNVPKEAHL